MLSTCENVQQIVLGSMPPEGMPGFVFSRHLQECQECRRLVVELDDYAQASALAIYLWKQESPSWFVSGTMVKLWLARNESAKKPKRVRRELLRRQPPVLRLRA